jgi:hypothetical protein
MSKDKKTDDAWVSSSYISTACGVMALLSSLVFAASLGADWTVASVISLISLMIFGSFVIILEKDEW